MTNSYKFSQTINYNNLEQGFREEALRLFLKLQN